MSIVLYAKWDSWVIRKKWLSEFFTCSLKYEWQGCKMSWFECHPRDPYWTGTAPMKSQQYGCSIKAWTRTVPADVPTWVRETSQGSHLRGERLAINDGQNLESQFSQGMSLYLVIQHLWPAINHYIWPTLKDSAICIKIFIHMYVYIGIII